MTRLSQGLAAGLLALSFGVATDADARGRPSNPATGTTQEAYVRSTPDGALNAQRSQVRGDAWIPDPEGSEEHQRQHEMLEPHRDFINSMGGCCNTRDGRGNLEEIKNDGSDPRFPVNPKFPESTHPYLVVITHDLTGKELDEPTILPIPKEKIISTSQARAYCKPKLMADKNSTCRPPAFNVLWAYDNSDESTYHAGIDRHRITTLYCYFPKPSLE